MSLFGRVNYDKPGPGVSKNAPKKRGFFVFFEIVGRKFWKLVIANLLYVLLSLPIVTHGLAQAGLTFVTRNYAREKHVFLPSDFFETIRKNWKQALPVGLLETFGGALLLFDLYFFGRNLLEAEQTSLMLVLFCGVTMFVLVVYSFMRYYIYLQLITFKLSFKQLIKNSFLFAFVGLKQNFLISALLLLMYGVLFGLFLLSPKIFLLVALLLFVFIFPAFRSMMIQYIVFPIVKKMVIDPYYKEHPKEDIEMRRNLNVEVDEPSADPETKPDEPVFEDTVSNKAQDEPAIPRQYTEEDHRRAKRLSRSDTPDDDDTI